jgi:hypothetical protein
MAIKRYYSDGQNCKSVGQLWIKQHISPHTLNRIESLQVQVLLYDSVYMFVKFERYLASGGGENEI